MAEEHCAGPDAYERRKHAQIAANTRWAQTPKADRPSQTARARAAAMARFERLVDPEGTMDPDERQERAAYAKKAHYSRMAYLAAKAKREKRAGIR